MLTMIQRAILEHLDESTALHRALGFGGISKRIGFSPPPPLRRMIRKVAVRLAALALAALAATLVLLVPGARATRSGVPRRRQALTGILRVTEEPRPPSSAGAATFAAARRPQLDQLDGRSSAPPAAAAAVSKYGGGSPSAQPSGAAPCCAFWPPRQLNVSLTWPVSMKRPVTVLMKAGNLDGRFACDVPCQYVTHAPADGGVDVVVGEAARPVVPEKASVAAPPAALPLLCPRTPPGPAQPQRTARGRAQLEPSAAWVRGRCGWPTRAC